MCLCGAAVHSLGWVRHSQEMEETDLHRSLFSAGPRQGRRCHPRTGEHKTLPTDKLLPAAFTHSLYLVDVVHHWCSLPQPTFRSAEGQRGLQARWYCRLGRLPDPLSCSPSGGCVGLSLENSIVFSLIPFLWSCREGSEYLGGRELVW